MIGAMPAVAVRHERRKQEKRNSKHRPGHLTLGPAGGGRQTSPPSRGSSPTPSPLQSPPPIIDDNQPCRRELPPEYYICGKVSILHLVVVSLLLGAILLIVGLVQLKPGADASEQKHLLMIGGSVLMSLGLVLSAIRCCRLAPCCRLHRVHERSSSVEDPPLSATKSTFPEMPGDSSREPLASATSEPRVECVITHEVRKTSQDEISVENLRRDSGEEPVIRA